MVCLLVEDIMVNIKTKTLILLTKTQCFSPEVSNGYLIIDVENLSAEPDYRAVKLRWNYYNEHHGLTSFKVK